MTINIEVLPFEDGSIVVEFDTKEPIKLNGIVVGGKSTMEYDPNTNVWTTEKTAQTSFNWKPDNSQLEQCKELLLFAVMKNDFSEGLLNNEGIVAFLDNFKGRDCSKEIKQLLKELNK